MKDAFALLGVPRRPWLDPDLLKQKFLSLSAQWHPDRLHNATEAEKRVTQDRFTELNHAYQMLLDPRERLLHLADLELGRKAGEVQNIPSDLMTLFFEVGGICRKADALIAEKALTLSPILKVQIFGRAQEQIEQLQELKNQVGASREGLLAEIRTLDTAWDATNQSERRTRWERLQQIAGLLNYSKKWDAEIAERIVRLSF